MTSLNMKGPYNLDIKSIDAEITQESPGNYAIGTVNKDGNFLVNYVGRSDRDINARIKQHMVPRHFKWVA
ncbi:hypothetical protein A6M27_14175 [Acidithiobacillus thiooxidans]|uniref:GIY-YIG domain-containing protein n=2 Tax=Acidithiobacillus thiooxidans TaxID=930 RepID=A0A1C2I2N6_ACITH|nr:hypothetical protein [Acidithiobacillus thiooxidans]OCX70157.1 hypothetical protein A6P07_15180 [Acidithiobacillus thiooxidans]OCX70702.1 hypothetical protein A6O24_16245 [Acidithiobacillus thiooxidans]OCX83095.1 hypothetical protein A6O26_08045 [Acidithiobacillus thiooxidans]OCX86008.1 hypothetical protein A6M27_14175 [Acidithiobacillus thiooxidans]